MKKSWFENLLTLSFSSFKLMPEHLKKLGYSSHVMGKWHLGYCNTSYLPTNRYYL